MPVKVIAFYLPQFHPIPENDIFWGKGFTEWTNVTKAVPLYEGHHQPLKPSMLGYYDLRDSDVREAQANLARDHGVSAFCYYHYWFAGKRVLELPFNEVLKSGKPDFPLVLCWANQSWTGVWYGSPKHILIEQTYPGDADFVAHFYSLLPAFQDKRYFRINGKPVFIVFSPRELPDKKRFTQLWTNLAKQNGLDGIYFIGLTWSLRWDHRSDGFNAAITQANLMPNKYLKKSLGLPAVFEADAIIKHVAPKMIISKKLIFPCLLPNWDNTARSGKNGVVMINSNPENFRKQLKRALRWAIDRPEDEKIIFIKAWNEWAEGNILEPESKHNSGFLEVLSEELKKQNDLSDIDHHKFGWLKRCKSATSSI